MADDAGALLVRSGLVPSSALDDARVRVANLGGTVGEQLVAAGTITDDALTDFYRSRLLVPQVNPNTLARLPTKVVTAIPSDMAIELRAIPVSLDNDNNLTVAMSDPSDSHAVDEIAFFTGTYVVRAVATQMQIAWCLAHYYGHVTALGAKLLQPTEQPKSTDDDAVTPPAGEKIPRTKGHTSKIENTRHRRIIPVTGQIEAQKARPNSAVLDDPTVEPPRTVVDPPKPTLQGVVAPPPAPPPADDKPKPRPRSISGEIEIVPERRSKRAQSIKPPEEDPYADADDLDEAPVITIEAGSPDEDPTGPRKVPIKRKKQKTDPPELAARGGEIDMPTGPVMKVDGDGPSIIIDDEPPPPDVSGELRVKAHVDHAAPATTIEVDDTSVGVVIHEHYKSESEPVLLQRRASTDGTPTAVRDAVVVDDDGEVIVLETKKPAIRSAKPTQMGFAPPQHPRSSRDTEAGGVPVMDDPTDPKVGDDPTRVDGTVVPRDPGDFSDEIAAPPPPATPQRYRDDDTSPHVAPPPIGGARLPIKRKSTPIPVIARANTDLGDGDDARGVTTVMTAVELDEAIPQRNSDVIPGLIAEEKTNDEARRIDYDPVDDGWGPPGTTIPPPLLGAMPGADARNSSQIPVPDVDSAPLIVGPPAPPEPARGSPTDAAAAPSLVRALEEATSRSVQLIHQLERAQSRDEVVALMSTHLAQTHRRAGFLSIKGGELALFSMLPKPAVLSTSTLRLDRPSTLQDVVGTRLPYRGPMHDDMSRNFLTQTLGICPPEILLVPVTVRERVVGVLFGDHRLLHTFDDQLALAARAAGMALERILKSKRG